MVCCMDSIGFRCVEALVAKIPEQSSDEFFGGTGSGFKPRSVTCLDRLRSVPALVAFFNCVEPWLKYWALAQVSATIVATRAKMMKSVLALTLCLGADSQELQTVLNVVRCFGWASFLQNIWMKLIYAVSASFKSPRFKGTNAVHKCVKHSNDSTWWVFHGFSPWV